MPQIVIFFAVTMMMSSFTLAKENLTIENQAIIAIVVSNEQNPAELNLSAKNLNLIFWRKQLFWPQGVPIKPVNLRSQDPLRIQFSEATLGSTPEAQIDYWNGQYFNGILPPYSVDSEEAVLRYIAKTKGAIGYVNACNVDERVQGLLWLMPNGEMRKTKPSLQSCVK
jgi:ABC-type phosphate transport system substrate-binding protein